MTKRTSRAPTHSKREIGRDANQPVQVIPPSFKSGQKAKLRLSRRAFVAYVIERARASAQMERLNAYRYD